MPHQAPAARSNDSVALRVASLAAKLCVDGLPSSDLTNWLNMLDRHFPGSFGQINHSERFARTFTSALSVAATRSMAEQIHQPLRALRLPSDYVRIIDGITPLIGESLLIHIVVIMVREAISLQCSRCFVASCMAMRH